MSGENFNIPQLLEWAKTGVAKEADEVMGYPAMNPPAAGVAPVPMEEGVASPGQKAQERSNQDPLDESVGDTLGETKAKLMSQLEHRAGAEMLAASHGEDPKELPNAALKPAKPQTVATPAAPPGQGGPMPEPSMSMDMKMSSIFEQKGNELLLASKEATDNGDSKLAQDLAAKAKTHLDLAQDHSTAVRKEAEAKAAVAALLSGKQAAAPAGGSAPVAPEGEPTDEEKRAHFEQVADDYEGMGELMGTKHASVVAEQLVNSQEFINALAEKLGEAFLPVATEKLGAALTTVLASAEQKS